MPNSPLIPPGRSETVAARSVLVLAPHYDDEVLGCGGLVADLTQRGIEVRVLYLTDGAASVPADGDRDAYVATRRAEARAACEILGITAGAELMLPDGRLARHVGELSDALRAALLEQRPDLLLSPSPLEASEDHRATFAAVHRLLGGLRDGDELLDLARDLRIFLWEANRLLFPDLLVDVSDHIETFERAMACHASQESLHPYLQAALGIRRWRAATLGPDVHSVEAYRGLRLDDFRTRGPSALLEHLGGTPHLEVRSDGPKVSIIVRTKDRPELLEEALASLARQTWRPLEVVLVNDGGASPAVPEDFPLEVVRVELEQNQGRAAAADAGVAAATGEYVGFLDDDDLLEPEHVEALVGAVSAAGVRVAYSDAAVGVYELTSGGWSETERRLPYSRDFDPELLRVDNYLPFNTLLVERGLFAEAGPFDRDLPFFEDWDFLLRLARHTPFHHLPRVTCEYRQFRGAGHHVLGDRPRERDDFLAMKAKVIETHLGELSAGDSARPFAQVVAGVVDRLRAEAVAAAERAGREAERRESIEIERHALNGRLDAVSTHVRVLEGAEERLRAEIAETRGRLEATTRELTELRGLQQSQSDELERAYAELGRLDRLVREMESTRAWKLHQKLQGLRPGRDR